MTRGPLARQAPAPHTGLPAATAVPSSAEERLARREAVLHQRRVQRWRLAHAAAGHPAGPGPARGR